MTITNKARSGDALPYKRIRFDNLLFKHQRFPFKLYQAIPDRKRHKLVTLL